MVDDDEFAASTTPPSTDGESFLFLAAPIFIIVGRGRTDKRYFLHQYKEQRCCTFSSEHIHTQQKNEKS